MPDVLYVCAITAWSIALARVDFREHRLPDVLTLPAIPVAVASVAVLNPRSLTFATTTGVVLFALGFVAHQIADLGLGDVKLLPSVGILAANSSQPGDTVLEWLVAMAVFGGIHAVIHLAITRDRRSHIPFGPAILGGLVWTVAVG
jgi:leader peptidase (prepilin peptidase)/N-methyltransferase